MKEEETFSSPCESAQQRWRHQKEQQMFSILHKAGNPSINPAGMYWEEKDVEVRLSMSKAHKIPHSFFSFILAVDMQECFM